MRLSIIPFRKIYFSVSLIFALFSIVMLGFGKLNYGIDMTGGIQLEYNYSDYDFDQSKIGQEAQVIADHINLNGEIINNVNIYKITGEDSFIVEAGFTRSISDTDLESYKLSYKNQLGEAYQTLGNISLSRYTNIGASFGDYIKKTAYITLAIAILAIGLYIAYAFSGTVSGVSSYHFGLITIITLFHDVLISAGLFIFVSLFFHQFQIDTFFITALLTILGYSINDTIVVFDRIRTNLREFGGRGKNLQDIIESSISETLTRSIYTSMTVFFVLVCILVFGPQSIAGFTLTMLFGTVVGTYSSIFIASPLLYQMNKKAVLSVYVPKVEKTEAEKLVV